MEDSAVDQTLLRRLFFDQTCSCAEYCHPGESCLKYALNFIPPVFKVSLKYYLPIHLLPSLYFARKSLKENPLRFLLQILKNSLRSTLFMTALQVMIQLGTCGMNRNRAYDGYNGFFGNMFAGLSLLIEHPSRREELALFAVPNLYEALFAFLKKRGIYTGIHQNYNLIYALAMAIIANQYNGQKNTIKSSYRKLFQLLWGDL